MNICSRHAGSDPASCSDSDFGDRITIPSPRSLPEEDRMEAYLNRVVIETVQPQIDSGRFPARRAIGETVVVTADIFADSHDRISAELMFRKTPDARWQRRPLELLGNDRWQGAFRVSELGVYEYTVRAWIDHFATWVELLRKKEAAGQDLAVDLREGAEQVAAAATRASASEADRLTRIAEFLRGQERTIDRVKMAFDPDLGRLMAGCPDRRQETAYGRLLRVRVERPRAR
ncbi:MAG: maltotransferase domain-containing protein, partial [Gillisia sp.]